MSEPVSRIAEPGIYDMPSAAYHRDPAPAPSLSSSIAHLLMERSPRHAWHAHPKLNPAWEEGTSTTEQDEGTALHALILEHRSVVAVCEFPDWRTRAAQEARQTARLAGQVPILRRRWEELQPAAAAIRDQLRTHEAAPLLDPDHGRPEVVMAWQEETQRGPIWCRARVDWMPHKGRILGDLKTVGGSAAPGAWGKKMWPDGIAFQAAFYVRGARALGLDIDAMQFVVAEREAPFCVSVCTAAPSMEQLAEQAVEAAIETWGRCLHGGTWPGYEPAVAHIEAPGWALYEQEERTMRDDMRRKQKGDGGLHGRVMAVTGSPAA